MNNAVIPAGWDLWFHATSLRFDAFDDESRMENLGGDGNSGLGHFLAATISGAAQYVDHARKTGALADVLIVAALEERSYCASSDDFWCKNEDFSEEEDPLGLLPPGGLLTREKLLGQGYASLVIDDIDGTGAVMAMFESKNLRVLKRLKVTEAERLEAWLYGHHGGVTDPNERYALIEHWCAQDALRDRRTFAGLKERYSRTQMPANVQECYTQQ